MKKFLLSISFLGMMVFGLHAQNQTPLKIAVFDIDIMVQAMPGYRAVDSLVQIYERDSLADEYAVYQNEYKRLDSTYKADSAANKSKAILDYTKNQLQQMAMNLIYWQQIAQNKSDNKRGVLSQSMYEQVVNAYKAVLARKKYALILKPQTYEAGFPIDNLFISVAKELKLTELPQQLLVLGDDPDAQAKPPVTTPKK
ncbi:MAG: OmpH family outer membrane protein [Bacteroidetes bacterium]|nr:OmpH family outer membrane protein [Bacteroidota bacterium]